MTAMANPVNFSLAGRRALVTGANTSEQSASALQALHEAGWEPESDDLHPSLAAFDTAAAITVTYANAYAQASVTDKLCGYSFANTLTDPCDQPGTPGNTANNISSNPNRAANCAAAGVPTTVTYIDNSGALVTQPFSNRPGTGVLGINRGNPDLVPEKGDSITIGGIVQPVDPGARSGLGHRFDLRVERSFFRRGNGFFKPRNIADRAHARTANQSGQLFDDRILACFEARERF